MEWDAFLQHYKELPENTISEWVEYNLREIDRKQKEEYLEENYRKARHMGTSEDIKKAYKDLVTFKMSNLIKQGY